jgi:Protein of unknown function (DUF3040)
MPAYAGHVDIGHLTSDHPQGGDVPLSEHEQRLLEQMERALYAEDPKFASVLRGHDLRGRYRRRAFLGAFGVVVGLAMLPVGVAGKLVGLSVLGFLIMLGSAIFAVTSWRRTPAPGESGAAPVGAKRRRRDKSGTPKPAKVKFMDRLDERWRRRREGDGR